jgi:hypothetical protein
MVDRVDTSPPAAATPAARWLRQLPWLAGAIAAGLAAKNLVGSYADFGIYLDVAREYVAGGIDIHRDRVGSGPFLYPHVAALPFVALHELFGDAGARWAWSGLLGLATVWLLRAAASCVTPFGGLAWWQWLVFGVLFQRCIAQNLTHGQLSLCVGALVVAGSAALVHGRDVRAGVWFGLAAALKLTPALFLVALPLFGRTRAAVAMLATIGIAVFVLPWPTCGSAEHVRHLQTLADAVTQSMVAPEQAAITQSYAGPSIRGALDYLLQPRSPGQNGHYVNLFAVSDGTLRVVRLAWSIALAALFAAWCWRARMLPAAQRLAHQCAAVALAQCVFPPLLRTYHLAAAIVPFVLFCRGPRTRRDLLWFAAATVFLFTLTLRQKKLLGETLWRTLDGGAALHLGLVLAILWLARDANAAQQTRQ